MRLPPVPGRAVSSGARRRAGAAFAALAIALAFAPHAAAQGQTIGAEAGAPAAMRAPPPRPEGLVPEPPPVTEICRLIGESAARHAMPPGFFARLIWRESRFDVRAVSPVGAQGIAQFMPRTAEERGLENPWDPAQAIPASAEYLAALRGDFGNLGLAAAAYNAGPDRVSRWLSRGVRLPWETVRYVRAVTSRPVEWFRKPGRDVEARPLHPEKSFDAACADLPVMRTRAAPRPPWGVQVASGVSPSAARKAWARIRQRHQGALRASCGPGCAWARAMSCASVRRAGPRPGGSAPGCAGRAAIASSCAIERSSRRPGPRRAPAAALPLPRASFFPSERTARRDRATL